MPVFNNHLTKTLRNILVMFIFLWGASRLFVFSWPFLFLHNYSIGSLPSHYFLDRLADLAIPHESKSLLLLGPSTVREGFDTDLISKDTNFYVVNGGVTSRGSILHTEMQLDIASNFGIRTDVLLLGLNSRMLSGRDNPILATRYIDYLTDKQIEDHVMHHSDGRLNNDSAKDLDWISIQNKTWPANRLAVRLDNLLRFTLMRLNYALGNWNQIPFRGFSRGQDILIHPKKFLYKDETFNKEVFEQHWESMKRSGMMHRGNYGFISDIQTLHRVIEKAKSRSPNVIIMVMPEHSKARKHFGSWGDHAFFTVLNYYQGKIHVIDHSDSVDDSLLRDIGHLVPLGREKLSRLTAQYITDTFL